MSKRKRNRASNQRQTSQRQEKQRQDSQRPAKPPLLWSGILFALAANMLLVTLADFAANLLMRNWGLSFDYEILATLVAPLLAGAATALYVRQRGGMHAFLGGWISIPLLTYLVFGGYWQLGIFAGAFCTIGGASTELILRRRPKA